MHWTKFQNEYITKNVLLNLGSKYANYDNAYFLYFFQVVIFYIIVMIII